jgi:hypothetical protein
MLVRSRSQGEKQEGRQCGRRAQVKQRHRGTRLGTYQVPRGKLTEMPQLVPTKNVRLAQI